LKRHTALIKRIRQSLAIDNHDQILKEIETLSLEKYIDEIVSAVVDGIARCKTERDVWSAVEARMNWCDSLHILTVSIGCFRIAPSLSEVIHASACGYSVHSLRTTVAGSTKCSQS
jgi:hypothetical protein